MHSTCVSVVFLYQMLNICFLNALWSKFRPGKFELRQLDVHVVDDGWEWAFIDGQQRKAVFHRDQAQVHYKCIVGGGGLGDDNERGLQLNVHGKSETLLGEISNTRCCLLRCLSCHSAQSFFGHLEVVGEVLEKINVKTLTDLKICI